MENCLYYDAIHDFQYGSEPVLIQRILIGFEAILEYLLYRIMDGMPQMVKYIASVLLN